jgi:hypothetical protein
MSESTHGYHFSNAEQEASMFGTLGRDVVAPSLVLRLKWAGPFEPAPGLKIRTCHSVKPTFSM